MARPVLNSWNIPLSLATHNTICQYSNPHNYISNFQHLSWTWDFEWQDSEKLMDFTDHLENTTREAMVHIKNKFKKDSAQEMPTDTVYSLMSIMLMNEKVKARVPNVYPHVIKTMNNHYTACSIAGDAQRYLYHSITTDNVINHNLIVYYMHGPQQWSQGNVPNKLRQPLRISRQPSHS